MFFQRAACAALGLMFGCGTSGTQGAASSDGGVSSSGIDAGAEGASGRCNLTDTWGIPTRSAISSAGDESAPMLSWDGLEIYFPSDRPGGAGNYDLYVARRASTSDSFGTPVELREIDTTYNEDTPYITLDKLTLYFASNRPGGVGGIDIWRARRNQVDQPFGNVENVVALNSTSMDVFPFISFDQHTLLFASDRANSVGQIYVGDVNKDQFSNIRPLSEVNSAFGESSPWLERDGRILYFSSTRAAMNHSDWNIFIASRPDTASPFANIARVSFDTSDINLDTTITPDDCTLFFTSTRPGTIGQTDIWQVTR